MHRRLGALALATSLATPGLAQSHRIEVDAGAHARVDTPVSAPLPADLAGTAVELVEVDGDRRTPVPAQVEAGPRPRLWWILRGRTDVGKTRSFELRATATAPDHDDVVRCSTHNGTVHFTHQGDPVLAFHGRAQAPPEGVKPIYARSGYIHPVQTPQGRVVTGDFPPAHRHHHGIWFPWTKTAFRGVAVDFWNSAKAEGRVECVDVSEHDSGAVFAFLRAGLRHVALKVEDNPVTVLEETWTLRVYALAGYRLFDLESVQRCATETALELGKYRYGGLGFRGSEEWEGKGDRCQFLASTGKTRADGHATRADWCAIWQEVDGAFAGIAILCHPDNFRSPQPMRIHPSEPFFNFAPCQAGDFAIEPKKPLVSRYRFFVFDGEARAADCQRHWHDYATPPEVRVRRG